MSTRSKLEDMFLDILGEQRGNLANSSNDLFNDGYIDSYTMIELVVYIEDTLTLKIPEEHLTPDAFRSVDSLARLCDTLVE
jgi:acyl carrier protein